MNDDDLTARIHAAVHSPDPVIRADNVARLIEAETATLRDTLTRRSDALNRVTAALERCLFRDQTDEAGNQ